MVSSFAYLMNSEEAPADVSEDQVEEAYVDEREDDIIEDDPDLMLQESDEELIFENDSAFAFDSHTDSIFSIALHPTIPVVVTGGGDDISYAWSLLDGKEMAKLTGHEDSVIDCCFSQHDRGKYVLTGGMDGRIRVWKVGKQWEFMTGSQEVEELVWLRASPTKGTLAAGATDGSIWVHSIPDLTVSNCFYAHTSASTSGSFSADGMYLLTTSGDGSVTCFNVDTGEQLFKADTSDARLGGAEGWTAGVISSQMAIIGSSTGEVRVLSLKGDILAAWDFGEGVESIDWNSEFVAIGGIEGKIGIFTVGSWHLRKTMQHEDAVVKVEFVENSFHLTTCSVDKTVRRWDIRTGEQERVWKGHSEGVLGFVQSMDGSTIVSAGDDGIALVFKV